VSDHIVLVGMMGAGKTSIGRRVADALDRPFVDSDAQIERRTGRTVAEIWRDEGESAFRILEAEALGDALAHEEPSVIAAAGGTVLDPENRRLITGAGRVVWLRADPDVLATRVRSGAHRPLLDEDPATVLHRLSAERGDLYGDVADVVVDVDDLTPDQAVECVLAALA
jgi:shikimate kinase